MSWTSQKKKEKSFSQELTQKAMLNPTNKLLINPIAAVVWRRSLISPIFYEYWIHYFLLAFFLFSTHFSKQKSIEIIYKITTPRGCYCSQDLCVVKWWLPRLFSYIYWIIFLKVCNSENKYEQFKQIQANGRKLVFHKTSSILMTS